MKNNQPSSENSGIKSTQIANPLAAGLAILSAFLATLSFPPFILRSTGGVSDHKGSLLLHRDAFGEVARLVYGASLLLRHVIRK